MKKIALIHANLVDTISKDVREDSWIRIEDGVIRSLGQGSFSAEDDEEVIDCSGLTVMPGLIDAHAHMGIVRLGSELPKIPRAVYAALVFKEMKDTLEAGFTTVRDAGFTDASFKYAVEQGLVPGPRMLVSNGALSITGGHSDRRDREDSRPQMMTDGLYWPGMIADGVAEVRRATREVLRRGADQVKIMAAGGVEGSGQDDVEDDQYSAEEIAAIVGEARSRNTYVMAHCNSPRSILNSARNGVLSIEHGNFLNEEAADYLAEHDIPMVPTIMNYQRLASHARDHLPAKQVAKVDRVVASASNALKIAHDRGVRIGLGTDAIAGNQPFKGVELEIQATVQGTMGAIVAATKTNAEILRLDTKIGRIATGYQADLLILDGDPIADIALFQDRSRILVVMKGGEIAVDRRI